MGGAYLLACIVLKLAEHFIGLDLMMGFQHCDFLINVYSFLRKEISVQCSFKLVYIPILIHISNNNKSSVLYPHYSTLYSQLYGFNIVV